VTPESGRKLKDGAMRAFLVCLLAVGAAAFSPPSALPLNKGLRQATAAPRGHVGPLCSLAPASGSRVVVLGGGGFVGSRVSKLLAEAGAEVTSISKTGSRPAWASGEPWVSDVEWVAGDPAVSDLSQYLRGASAVVSCIGVIGGSDEEMRRGNGEINVQAVAAAREAGVPKFVYVSVGSAVKDNVGSIALKGYFEGKRQAEDAILDAYGAGSSLIVCPTFIYGGDSFAVNPPRVTSAYGSFVEASLSLGPVRTLAGILPGVLGLALRPPVSVNDVAAAAAGGALGRVTAWRCDGTDEIKFAAEQASTSPP